MYGMLKLASSVGSDYYPEIMGNMFVINAPFFFSGVWSVVKSFIDEKTRKKIKIMSSGHEKVLLELVDANTLPKFLGGNCTCANHGGDCMTSNIGPWNDFEIVKPKGIVRKGQSEKAVEAVIEAVETLKIVEAEAEQAVGGAVAAVVEAVAQVTEAPVAEVAPVSEAAVEESK